MHRDRGSDRGRRDAQTEMGTETRPGKKPIERLRPKLRRRDGEIERDIVTEIEVERPKGREK